MEMQIIRAAEFIRLGPSGSIDLEASRHYLKALARACRKRGISRALIDIRGIVPKPTPQLSPEDLASLVNCFREMGFCENDRLAVLYSRDPHHGARTFAFLSNLQGWNVEAFNDFEAAMGWLSEAPEDEEQTRMSHAPVKVTHRGQKRPKHATTPKLEMESRRGLLVHANGAERNRKESRRA
jgi:hypothetical protein